MNQSLIYNRSAFFRIHIHCFFSSLRVFVATWNVGGRTPNNDLNLEDFLLVEGTADIYICGYELIFDNFRIRRSFNVIKE